MQRLILIGYRGTGKTTVGRMLAESLGFECVDADDEIEREAGTSIKQIFATEGEAGFRQRETKVVADLCKRDQVVIAMGGGAVLREENRAAMRLFGSRVCWLRASAETLHGRINADETTSARRPNLTAGGGLDEIVSLIQQREPLYRETADHAIDTEDKSIEAVVEEIRAWLASVN